MSKAFVKVLEVYSDGPINRETYLNTAWGGQPPRVGPELEAEFPEYDARFMEFAPTTHEEVAAARSEKAARAKRQPLP